MHLFFINHYKIDERRKEHCFIIIRHNIDCCSPRFSTYLYTIKTLSGSYYRTIFCVYAITWNNSIASENDTHSQSQLPTNRNGLIYYRMHILQKSRPLRVKSSDLFLATLPSVYHSRHLKKPSLPVSTPFFETGIFPPRACQNMGYGVLPFQNPSVDFDLVNKSFHSDHAMSVSMVSCL